MVAQGMWSGKRQWGEGKRTRFRSGEVGALAAGPDPGLAGQAFVDRRRKAVQLAEKRRFGGRLARRENTPAKGWRLARGGEKKKASGHSHALGTYVANGPAASTPRSDEDSLRCLGARGGDL